MILVKLQKQIFYNGGNDLPHLRKLARASLKKYILPNYFFFAGGI